MSSDKHFSNVLEKVRTGSRISILVNEQTGDELELHSVFESDVDDTSFIISAPFYRNALYPLREEQELSFTYHTNKSQYAFQGVVRERFKRGELNFLRVERIGALTRTQRREDYRIEISVEARLTWGEGEAGEQTQQKGRTTDLSGGGTAVRLNRTPREREQVEVSLCLPDFMDMPPIMAEVRWITRRENDTEYKYLCGLKFTHSVRQDKERLVKYLFKIQQQRMRTDVKRPLEPDDWA